MLEFSKMDRVIADYTSFHSSHNDLSDMHSCSHFLLLALVSLAAADDTSCVSFTSPRVVIGCWQILERHPDEMLAVETLKAYAHAGFTTFGVCVCVCLFLCVCVCVCVVYVCVCECVCVCHIFLLRCS
jgi:hypothetical protein